MIKRFLISLFLAAASVSVAADDNDYVHIASDLDDGRLLQEIADRAYENAAEYWEPWHDHPRGESHEHPDDEEDLHPGGDEVLSAYEAVYEIYALALERKEFNGLDPDALDIIKVAIAVIDAWPNCSDTYEAVQHAVELMPNRAAEIVASVAVKKDCNCTNAGLWLDQRVDDRIRPDLRHALLDVPLACSCSQAALYAGIGGLPENIEFAPDASDEHKQLVVEMMTERVQEIIDRTVALQSKSDWECGCVNVNIAASMRGIQCDELQEGVYDALADKYVNEVGDRGLVVDAFGVIGRHPRDYWGIAPVITRDHVLRRQPVIYRGDSLVLDPFDPAVEWYAWQPADFTGLGSHQYSGIETPTDVVMSEIVEGHHLQMPLIPEPQLIKHTITLDSNVTFELDKYEVRPEAGEVLKRVIEEMNTADIFSGIEIVGHTCDLAPDDYNQVLSENRAQAVKQFLLDNGLAITDIKTKGRGESEPRYPNDSEASRSKNRRVEISFMTQEVPDLEIARSDNERRSVAFSYVRPEDIAAAEAARQTALADWQAAKAAREDIDDEYRNRALELFNGTDELIDLGAGQYFLEIYAAEDDEVVMPAADPQKLVRNTITLDSEVTFELDKHDIRPSASATLEEIVDVINRADVISEILIVGHTCDLAPEDYNQALSERRAQSVRDFLLASGLEVETIRIEGHGEGEPRFPNDSEFNRAKNRRVEITFVALDEINVESSMSDGETRQVEISWISKEAAGAETSSGGAITEWETTPIPVVFNERNYVGGEMTPRQVIGLNGRIEPGETFVIAHSESEEEITDRADLVTGQLDFRPNETLVLRRVAGEMLMACRAGAYSYILNYPVEPVIRPVPIVPIRPPGPDDLASPN